MQRQSAPWRRRKEASPALLTWLGETSPGSLWGWLAKSLMPGIINLSAGLRVFGVVCGQTCSYYIMFLLEKRVNRSSKGMLGL